MIISVKSTLKTNVGDLEGCGTPESRRYGINSLRDMNVQVVSIDANEAMSSEDMTERIRVNKGGESFYTSR